jgi:hypothetical protein
MPGILAFYVHIDGKECIKFTATLAQRKCNFHTNIYEGSFLVLLSWLALLAQYL